MKARVSTILTLLAIVGASGGALALASGSGGSGATSAASSQYRPHKHCKPHHRHCPPPRRHHHHPHRGRHAVLPGRASRPGPAAPTTTAPAIATLLGQGAPGSSTVPGVTTTSGATDLVIAYFYGSSSCSSVTPTATGPFSGTAGSPIVQSIGSSGGTNTCMAVLPETGNGQTGPVSVSAGSDHVGFVNVVQLAPGTSILSSGQHGSSSPSGTALATLGSTAGSQIAVVGTGGTTTITPPTGLGLLPGFTPQSSSSVGPNGATLGIYSGSPALSSASFGLSPSAPWGTIALLVG